MELHRKACFDPPCDSLPSRLPYPRPAPQGKRMGSQPIRVLLIEHDSTYAARLRSMMGEQGQTVLQLEWTRWLDVAACRIREGQPDAVLLDISLPDISGIEIFRAIHHGAPHVPILILADLDEENLACQLLREGAQDYLPKHALDAQIICRSVRFAVERTRARKRAVQRKGETPPGACLETSLLEWPASVTPSPPPSPDKTVEVLIVERSDRDYRKFRACVEGQGEIRLTRTRTIRGAFRVLAHRAVDLVCLDYVLPDGTGHDFLTRMRESGLDIPAVVITAHNDAMTAAQIIQAGAYDYLPKQKLSRSPLFRIILNAVEKARLRKQIKEARRRIVEMSLLDDLTGLHNRRTFMDALEKEAGRAARYGSALVLCMLDVDEFKRINDTFGHQAGDMVLRELGALLRNSIRLCDTACRYGGDEFALLLPNTELREARTLGERLRRMVENHRFTWSDHSFQVTVSMGMTSPNAETCPLVTGLVESADMALYAAKSQGKNRVVAQAPGEVPE